MRMLKSCIINKGSFSEEYLSEFEMFIFSFSALRIFALFIISFQMLLCHPVSHYVSSLEAGKLLHTVICVINNPFYSTTNSEAGGKCETPSEFMMVFVNTKRSAAKSGWSS